MTADAHRDHGIHPNVILAVTALAGMAYSMLSSAVIPALPSIQHSLGATETGVTWLLTGYLLSASVATSIIGRLGDMYGKERLLLITLGILGVGTLVSALSTSLGPMIVGAHHPGRRRGHLPARLRDRPRRVPARARGRQHRDPVLDPRHRRRESGSCSAGSSWSTWTTTGCSGSRSW